jgi:hypothetical protein
MNLSFDPVDEYAEMRFGNRVVSSDRDSATWTLQSPLDTLALTVGVCRSNVYKWKRKGLSITQADRLSIALGLHPSALWPEWYKLPVACDAC